MSVALKDTKAEKEKYARIGSRPRMARKRKTPVVVSRSAFERWARLLLQKRA